MSAEATSSRSGVPVGAARLDALHARFYPLVLAYCLRRIRAEDAHEVASETFAIAWRRLDVVPAGDQALPWLYGVARRVLLHKYRRARRDAKLLDRLGRRPLRHEPGPELQLVRSVEHELVHRAAAQLSESDREILRLHVWEELTHAEAAQVLAIETEAAKQRFHRAKQRLARHFERISGGEPASPGPPRGGTA